MLVTGIGAGTQTLKIFGDLAVAGPMTVSGISDLTVEGAIFSGQLTVAVSDDVTFDDLVDIAGPINVSADSDNNGSGELFVDGTVESGGNPISFHGDQIVLELQVDAGSGDIKYSLSPNGSASALLENSITSGTATVSQDNSTSVSFSGVANSNLTGNVVLNFPLEVLLTTGLDTSARERRFEDQLGRSGGKWGDQYGNALADAQRRQRHDSCRDQRRRRDDSRG